MLIKEPGCWVSTFPYNVLSVSCCLLVVLKLFTLQNIQTIKQPVHWAQLGPFVLPLVHCYRDSNNLNKHFRQGTSTKVSELTLCFTIWDDNTSCAIHGQWGNQFLWNQQDMSCYSLKESTAKLTIHALLGVRVWETMMGVQGLPGEPKELKRDACEAHLNRIALKAYFDAITRYFCTIFNKSLFWQVTWTLNFCELDLKNSKGALTWA